VKVTKNQLRQIIREERALIEAYNSISPRSKSLANAAKRQFAKDYPDVQVGIDGREGWITVNGKKAVNMSQASGSPLSMDDIIDQMKQAYLGHPMSSKEVPETSPGSRPGEHKLDFGKDIGTYNYRNEGTKMKITKHQLRRIIREERVKLLKEADWGDTPWTSRRDMDNEVERESIRDGLLGLVKPLGQKIADKITSGNSEEFINALAGADTDDSIAGQIRVITTILDYFDVDYEGLQREDY
jgi:hypothetical protein